MSEEKRVFIRPSWGESWMEQAKVISRRSTCLRRRFGAVIVADKVNIAQGYKGAPSRWENCHDIGECFRQTRGVPRGERYELCRGVHAEINAILQATKKGVRIPEGSEMYIYGVNVEDDSVAVGKPCKPCMKVIANTNIGKVFYNAAIIDDGKVTGYHVVSELVSDWAWEYGRYSIDLTDFLAKEPERHD